MDVAKYTTKVHKEVNRRIEDFRDIWSYDSAYNITEGEARRQLFKLVNEIREHCGESPCTYAEFDLAWQWHTVFAEDFIDAKYNLIGLILTTRP